MTPRHLSPSQLWLYEHCPARWKARYVDGVVEPPTLPMEFGSAVHTGLEVHYQGGDGIGAFVASWSTRSAAIVARGETVGPGLEQIGARLVSQVMALGLRGTPERKILIESSELVGQPILGYADLWDEDGGTIVDFKTSAMPWTQKRADAAVWQPALYSLAFRSEVGILPRFQYVALGRRTGHVERFTTSRTEDQIMDAMVRAAAIAQHIRAQHWGCTCGRCGEQAAQPLLLQMPVPATRLAPPRGGLA